jgi:hypothetical protein
MAPKRVASGTVTTQQAVQAGTYNIIVSGLTFLPSIIVAGNTTNNTSNAAIFFYRADLSTSNFITAAKNTNYPYNMYTLGSQYYVNATGFRLGQQTNTGNVKWIAIE